MAQPIQVVIPKKFTLFTYFTKDKQPGCPLAHLMQAAGINVPARTRRDAWDMWVYEEKFSTLLSEKYSYNHDEVTESINRMVFDVDDQGDELNDTQRDALAGQIMNQFISKYPKAFKIGTTVKAVKKNKSSKRHKTKKKK
jgi:hypothetical protein